MTVTTEVQAVGSAAEETRSVGSEPPAGVPADLVDQLMEKVRAEGLEPLGEGGVIAGLTKTILERALEEERTEHLGYERGDAAGRGSGNSRNGTTPKRVLTEIGAVDLDIPRDRDGTFSPAIVPKGVSRLAKFNDNIIAFYAQGLSTRDIRKTIKRLYDVDVSADLISRVTDGVLAELADWRARPSQLLMGGCWCAGDGGTCCARRSRGRSIAQIWRSTHPGGFGWINEPLTCG